MSRQKVQLQSRTGNPGIDDAACVDKFDDMYRTFTGVLGLSHEYGFTPAGERTGV